MIRKDLFIDIFKYHNETNQKLIDQLIGIEDKITERSAPLISHMLNAHQLWNKRIDSKYLFDGFIDHSLRDCKVIEQQNYLNTLDILEDRNLNEVITYSNSNGQKFNNNILEILYHITNHHSHHRGQIISDIRKVGVDPIISDYIFYKR